MALLGAAIYALAAILNNLIAIRKASERQALSNPCSSR